MKKNNGYIYKIDAATRMVLSFPRLASVLPFSLPPEPIPKLEPVDEGREELLKFLRRRLNGGESLPAPIENASAEVILGWVLKSKPRCDYGNHPASRIVRRKDRGFTITCRGKNCPGLPEDLNGGARSRFRKRRTVIIDVKKPEKKPPRVYLTRECDPGVAS